MIGTVQGYSTYIGQPTVDPQMVSRLEDAILGAQSFIEIYVGYPLEIHETTCTLDGTGNNYIFIPDFPIVEISTIEHYNENEDAWIDYVIENTQVRFRTDSAIGEVKLINAIFFSGFQNIRIAHTSGYDFNNMATLDFKAKGVMLVLYEIATLFYDNPGLLSFKSVEAGITKSRYSFSDSQVLSLLSPELVTILFSFAKRGVSR